MTNPEFVYPSVVAFRNSPLLAGLDNRDVIFSAIADPDHPEKLLPEIEHQIFSGTQELIDMFNGIGAEDPILSIPALARTKALKEKIGSLPNLSDLKDKWQVAMAFVNGSKRMMDGQTNKERKATGQEVTKDEVDLAIGTPSMPIPPETKAIGTALHFIERAFFAHFRNTPESNKVKPELNDWKKDEILFALEDMAQVRHAQRRLALTDEPEAILFEKINTPNDLGGLGWRKQANLDAIISELGNL